jgi:hypothetical protein
MIWWYLIIPQGIGNRTRRRLCIGRVVSIALIAGRRKEEHRSV